MKNSLTLKILIRYIKSHKSLYKGFNFHYTTQKYTLTEILTEILYVLKTGISWRMLRSHINWNTIYKAYVKLNKFKIFKTCYKDLLKKIYKTSQKQIKIYIHRYDNYTKQIWY